MPDNLPFKKLLFILGSIFLIIGIFFIWPMEVTVTGVGSVEVPVEEAILAMTVTDINTSPTTAVQNLTTKITNLTNTLTQNGAEASDITKSQIQVIPASTLIPGAQGYAATAVIGGPVTNLDNIGGLTANLYEQGATLVERPLLRNETQEALEKQALDEAIDDARTQATAIGRKHFRFFKHTVAVSQTPANDVAAATKTGGAEAEASGFAILNRAEEASPVPQEDVFTLNRVVNVTYKVW